MFDFIFFNIICKIFILLTYRIYLFFRCLDCPPGKEQMTLDELNVITKDSEKIDEEFSEDQNEDVQDSLSENEEEKFEDIQTIES